MSLHEPNPASGEPRGSLTEATPGLPLLLIVDQNAETIAELTKILQPDHDIHWVSAATPALAYCQERLPDLILIAMEIPGTSGLDVCLRLKGVALTRYIPIIFTASQHDSNDEARVLHDGAVDFIVMPSTPTVVRARVQTHLMLRRATKKILAFNSTLEGQVAQRTAELKANMETLTEFREKLVSSEAKSTLNTIVASVSHELATPIGNSMLTATMLLDQTHALREQIDAGQLKRSDLGVFLKVMSEGTELMERNMSRARDLLSNFKQVALDQASEQRRSFDLALVVRGIVQSMMPSLKNKPQKVTLAIPDGITMNSLPGRLGQVVINLINNAFMHAFDARTHGELTISAHTGADSGAGHVLLRFEDDGVGIPEENVMRMFVPFFSTKIGNGGSGLGMSIVKNLVEGSLGGSIAVESTVGVGTRFHIRLPLVVLVNGV